MSASLNTNSSLELTPVGKVLAGFLITAITFSLLAFILRIVSLFLWIPRSIHWLCLVGFTIAIAVSLYGSATGQAAWMILYRKFRNTPVFRSIYLPVRNLLTSGWWGVLASSLISAVLVLPFWLAYQPQGKTVAKEYVPPTWLEWSGERPYLAAVPVLWPVITAFVKRIDTLILGDSDKTESKMLNMLHAAREETSHHTGTIINAALSGKKTKREAGETLLEKLIERVYLSFNVIVPGDVETKLRVMRVRDGKIVDDVGRQPQTYVARTLLETLQNEGSAAMEAIKTKKMVIISDLQQEKARGSNSRYVECPQNKSGGKGSLICYPVVQRGRSNPVVYVLCIQAPEPMVLAEVNRKFYERELGTYDADFAICDVLLGSDA